MKAANPYLYFADGKTLAAFTFYQSVFGGDFVAKLRYGDFPNNPMGVREEHLDRIAHIALPLGPHNLLMGTDHLPGMPTKHVAGSTVTIALDPESVAEAEALFEALAEGGAITVPLARTSWAERHGSLIDRFGVQWMVDYTGDAALSVGG